MSGSEEWREAKERAFQAAQVTEHAGWAEIKRVVEVEIAKRQRGLVGGGSRSFEDYKATCGWLEGASFVLNAPQLLEEIANRLRGT